MMTTSADEELHEPPEGDAIAQTRPPRPSSIKTEDRQKSASREQLRRDMKKLRSSLTITEQSFLESLAVHGDEVEVQVARKRLNDVSLFFRDEDEKGCDEFNDQEGFGDAIAIGKTEDEPRPLSPLKLVKVSTLNSSTSSHTSRRSSVKMQKHFETRRNSGIHEQLWKAHANGLAVTSSGSRKSVVRRASSIGLRTSNKEQVIRNNSFLSTATQDLLLAGGPMNRQGEDDIFRGSNNSLDGQMSPRIPKSIIRPPDIPPPLGMGRMRSDGSRRSVSFKAEILPPSHTGPRQSPRRARKNMLRDFSEDSLGSDSGASHLFSSNSTIGSFPALNKGKPVRSESLNSVHSLHKAHTLRSESMISVASLHRAHPVRSDSVLSAITTDDQTDPAWASPRSQQETSKEFQRHPNAAELQRPTLLRMASRNAYQGEGIEVTEWDGDAENINKARLYASMLSMGENSVHTTGSWDETMNRGDIFRDIRTTYSDDQDLANYFLGDTKSLLGNSIKTAVPVDKGDEDDDKSWDMHSDMEERPDAWGVLKDPYAIGYGAHGSLPFRILGTSAMDQDSMPHVLSPPLMESLQNFFPFGVSEDNFWMKYSLIRDGASLHSMLQNIRGAKYTILAMETSDGEVFGSFTSEPWRKNWNYFGTGESFLWRMRQSRNTPCHSIIDQAQLESELDVFPWTGENNCVQLCTHDKIAVGGGTTTSEKKEDPPPGGEIAYGFGLAVGRDLHHGTSSHCATFGSPPLSKNHQDGSPFEIMNLEVWTLTPCYTLEDAEKLELGKLFLASQ
mmetsp:Transcript_23580/g.39015  ORF Transcript_23580/g.39015 Transcript_23580/m.39015 type:complete len:787 (-) Transcript_23580:382-2742(-)